MSIEEALAKLRGTELSEGTMVVDVVMIARMVEMESGEEILVTTKTPGTSVFTALGMIAEAGLDVEAVVQWREDDEELGG